MQYRPETAAPLRALAETLLRGPSSLSRGERELVATYVSSRNACAFCTLSHAAVAAHQLGEWGAVERVLGGELPPLGDKMGALLRIAGKVQADARAVSAKDVAAAKAAGASDEEVHDVVLIAAAFCMFNRYVDGLGATTPGDPAIYEQAAAHLVERGYDPER
ncbi:MAG TPA: carboxymuconolactone decarboxylase family protein [Polyangiaceae bacterium]|nr:carboxymuconolactone decarboxylase family protein [Polyangiaceae bacterium]